MIIKSFLSFYQQELNFTLPFLHSFYLFLCDSPHVQSLSLTIILWGFFAPKLCFCIFFSFFTLKLFSFANFIGIYSLVTKGIQLFCQLYILLFSSQSISTSLQSSRIF